ncbi:CLUMA_CG001754, isoform A [Clunio marinus]|uniref:Ragulator complex protein LAMTOR1 n=1 Tax=Clunio marinus TaxID=568069 RepID=A0A1J1HIU0_9DIPT|nr:CLUMA_CG001754, isoform A [Clunio marinus]
MDYIRSAMQSIAACCLNCQEETTRAGEPTERTALLIEQQQRRNIANSPQIRRISEEDIEYASSLPKRDEQTALNRIVQETNSNIIDVSALDTHLLEPSEYNDRVKLYAQRIAHQWNSIQYLDTKYNGLLKDVPNADVLLASNPKVEEINMIKNFVKDAAQAINEMKVENNDELVVPFLIT